MLGPNGQKRQVDILPRGSYVLFGYTPYSHVNGKGGETAQKVKGFDFGADAYLVKPFEVAEPLNEWEALSLSQPEIGRLEAMGWVFPS